MAAISKCGSTSSLILMRTTFFGKEGWEMRIQKIFLFTSCMYQRPRVWCKCEPACESIVVFRPCAYSVFRTFAGLLIMKYAAEIEKRKTFAIISHPDAGKTTLTEKLLLFGGAINTAGAVKRNKANQSNTSD